MKEKQINIYRTFLLFWLLSFLYYSQSIDDTIDALSGESRLRVNIHIHCLTSLTSVTGSSLLLRQQCMWFIVSVFFEVYWLWHLWHFTSLKWEQNNQLLQPICKKPLPLGHLEQKLVSLVLNSGKELDFEEKTSYDCHVIVMVPYKKKKCWNK